MIHSWLTTQLEENKPKAAIASLDGVRAIACLIVIAYHISLITRDMHLWTVSGHPLATAITLAGSAGVTLFFVLSGFLLFLPYAKALLFEQPWPGARSFYLRRALRIIPGYYFSLFLMVLLARPDYLQPQHWNQLLLFLFFFMDSSKSTFQQLNGPYWTLAVEWQFYLLLPLIALGIGWVTRWVRPAWRFWAVVGCLLGMIGWGLLTRYWGTYFMGHPSETFLVPRSVLNVILFFTYGTNGKFLEDFAIGMLAGLGYTFVRDPARAKYLRWMYRLSPWFWGSGILLLVFMAMQHSTLAYRVTWPFLPGHFTIYPWLYELGLAVGFCLCVLAILFDGAALKRFFEWAPLRWIGLISYSLYIWHLPLLIAFMHNVGPALSGVPTLLAYSLYWVWVAVVIIPFSFASYLLIEKPGMHLSNRLRNRMAKQRKPQQAPTSQSQVAPELLEGAARPSRSYTS